MSDIPRFRWLLMLAFIALITWASLTPAQTFASLPRFLIEADKTAHFLVYGVLVALGRWVLLPHWQFRLTFFPLVFGSTAYGVLMELQPLAFSP